MKINATMEWDVDLDKMKIELVGGYAGTAPVEDYLQSAILCTLGTIKASGPNLDDLDFTWVDGLQMEPGDSLTRSTETLTGAGALTLTYFLKGVCP